MSTHGAPQAQYDEMADNSMVLMYFVFIGGFTLHLHATIGRIVNILQEEGEEMFQNCPKKAMVLQKHSRIIKGY